MGAASKDAASCKATCDDIHAAGYPVPGTAPACTYTWAAGKRTFDLCGQCTSPSGAPCAPKTADACYAGCAFAHGGAPARRMASPSASVSVDGQQQQQGPELVAVVEPTAASAQVGRGSPVNPYDSKNWQKVNATLTAAGDIVLDLSPLNGSAPVAVRYAWETNCCTTGDPAFDALEGIARPCPPGSCPVFTAATQLPGNPWVAKVVGGKCHCINPQTCDE